MAIKAVIFDIGGVLLLHDTSRQLQKQNGQTKQRLDEIFQFINRSGLGITATKGKISLQELWRQVGEHFKVDPQELQAFEAASRSPERLNTELAEFLQSLRPQYKTALLSNAWPEVRARLNEQYAIDKLADVLFFSSEEGMMKPDVNFYQLALMRLHVQANEVIFLDDQIVNVDGASIVGMHSIHYRDNEQALRDIKRVLFRYPQAS